MTRVRTQKSGCEIRGYRLPKVWRRSRLCLHLTSAKHALRLQGDDGCLFSCAIDRCVVQYRYMHSQGDGEGDDVRWMLNKEKQQKRRDGHTPPPPICNGGCEASRPKGLEMLPPLPSVIYKLLLSWVFGGAPTAVSSDHIVVSRTELLVVNPRARVVRGLGLLLRSAYHQPLYYLISERSTPSERTHRAPGASALASPPRIAQAVQPELPYAILLSTNHRLLLLPLHHAARRPSNTSIAYPRHLYLARACRPAPRPRARRHGKRAPPRPGRRRTPHSTATSIDWTSSGKSNGKSNIARSPRMRLCPAALPAHGQCTISSSDARRA